MTEQEYINVSNLKAVRAMKCIVRELSPAENLLEEVNIIQSALRDMELKLENDIDVNKKG